jgi:hypothetical protein
MSPYSYLKGLSKIILKILLIISIELYLEQTNLLTNLPLKYLINILIKKPTLRAGAKGSKTVTPSLNYFAMKNFYATYLDISMCHDS